MRSATIVGAGEIGGAVARALAARERFTHVRLVDDRAAVAAGKALDIRQAGPIDGYDTRVTGDGELGSVAGASVVIIADRAEAGEWTGDAALMLVKRVLELGADSPLVFAGAHARETIEKSAVELGVERRRLIGAAPEALRSAVRALVAIEANGSPRDVSLSLVGVPPNRIVVPWSDASIAGRSAAGVLDAPALARIDRRLPALWPPGPSALGAAAARIAEASACGSRCVFCAFAVLDARGTAAAVPVEIGERGIDRIVTPALDARERVAFENSVGVRGSAPRLRSGPP